MATAIGSYATATLIKSRAGITDATDDTLLGTIADQVNMYIERTTGRIIAPGTVGTAYYDGEGDNRIFLPVTADGTRIGGVRAITSLAVADYTGGAYTTLPAADYFLRGMSQPAGPYDWLYLSDTATGGYTLFPRGFNTVKLIGTTGWAAIPDDVQEVALTIAVRAWHARQNGQQDIVGTDEFGRPVVSRFVSGRDRDTLRAYTLARDLA
jgi:hypothetical protein